MNPARWKAWLAAAALLATGIAIGSGGTVYFGLQLARKVIAARPGVPAPLDSALAHLEASWVDELRLDDASRSRVHAELLRSGVELKQFRAETVQQLQQILNEMVVRSAATLTPEQRILLYRRAQQRLGLFGLPFIPPESGATAPPPRS